MFVSDSLGVNEAGHLTVGGCDAVALARQFGTPLYVMDEDLIRKNCRAYTGAIQRHYGGRGRILYASKAFSCKYIYRVMEQEGMGADVVSAGELYTALAAGFPAERIYFHGNNKTRMELNMAVQNRVGRIVVDNAEELAALNEIAREAGVTANILFRIKPGIEAHTHEAIMTGQIDSKFGVALETGEAMQIIKDAASMDSVRVTGVHCHIGSQIFELEPFRKAASVMMGLIGDVRDEIGLTLTELNLGGGYGIAYVPGQTPVEYDRFIEAVSAVVRDEAASRDLPEPLIVMEPGRSIVGPAGVTLYEVGCVKDIPNVRRYVSVDGGMCDNPRYILYESEYEFVVANHANAEKTQKVTVAGKCCESGDLLGKDVPLSDVHPGDILAVLATGAYNYSMASNYNRNPRPPVVAVSGGNAKLVVAAETFEDLIRNDL